MKSVSNIDEALRFVSDVKVVLFDLDDTLYSEKQYVKSGFNKIAEACPEIENMADKLWRAFEDGERPIDFVLKNENQYSSDAVKKCLETYQNQMPNISLYDGVIDLLTSLKESGFSLGLITDGRPIGQRNKINALGIEKYFEKIIVTDELGGIEFRKPNPKAFELMREFFGVDFPQMVYVGDNINKDFIAPEKLGMKWILVNNCDGLYMNTCDGIKISLVKEMFV